MGIKRVVAKIRFHFRGTLQETQVLFPLLSEADPVLAAEGSLDPLGMYPIADSLGSQLVPGVRERQSRPRFLTVTAVSLAICSEFPEDTVANDGTSEPWLVFEWHVVEGLTRNYDGSEEYYGLPGRLKAAAAIRDRVPLSASRYLKTPSVFGFHGVYRTLARQLGVEEGGRLGETGYELLATWEKEQGLEGFLGTAAGEGQRFRHLISQAVRDGLAKGAVDRSSTWQGWAFISKHLAHYSPGPRETEIIKRSLMDSTDGHRGAVLGFLVSSQGREFLVEGERTLPERELHRALMKQSDSGLLPLLEVIDRYEQFARLLQDAFDDALYEMSRARARIKVHELASLKTVSKAADAVPGLYEELCDALHPYGEASRFQETFSGVSRRGSARDWADDLVEHHRRVQRLKPPHGKAPWYERLDDGSYVIRPLYVRESGAKRNGEYVHTYRTGALRSFAQDLGMLD